MFTSAVVDGLATGAADRNGDGFVSVDELYDYAYDRVRAVTPSQTRVPAAARGWGPPACWPCFRWRCSPRPRALEPFAVLSPVGALLACLAVWLLAGGTRSAPRAPTGMLTATGAMTAVSAAGLVKFAVERVNPLGVVFALVTLAGGVTVLATGLVAGHGPATRQ